MEKIRKTTFFRFLTKNWRKFRRLKSTVNKVSSFLLPLPPFPHSFIFYNIKWLTKRQAIYASLRDTPFLGKCPDFCVDGVWYEHEGYDVNKKAG